MDILTKLDSKSSYSTSELQMILTAWVLATPLEARRKISTSNGHVAEGDYHKRSIYSLFYSLYRSMGRVRDEHGTRYELTFNTWGYEWPKSWGPAPTRPDEPERFGQNAYTGLYQFDAVRDYVAARDGKVHVVEMGCGTGAGANHVCRHVLPRCTYEAVDMQRAAIETCRRKFVPGLDGRLVATHADATKLAVAPESADIVAVCETHVTEVAGEATEEDQRFFRTAHSLLKKGGFLVWGNAIPDATWEPCFAFLESLGMRRVEVRDVTAEAVGARDQDRARVDAYIDQCLEKFLGFRIPVFGRQKRDEARLAMANFYRNPGTNLYDQMKRGSDTYKVVLFEKIS